MALLVNKGVPTVGLIGVTGDIAVLVVPVAVPVGPLVLVAEDG